MSATVLSMSMSLDGFVAGPNERPDNGFGDGGERLHEWVFSGAEDDAEVHPKAAAGGNEGANRQIVDEFMFTGPASRSAPSPRGSSTSSRST